MSNRKKRAFFRKKRNPSKLYANDRYRQNEAKKQGAAYTKASVPARIFAGWGW